MNSKCQNCELYPWTYLTLTHISYQMSECDCFDSDKCVSYWMVCVKMSHTSNAQRDCWEASSVGWLHHCFHLLDALKKMISSKPVTIVLQHWYCCLNLFLWHCWSTSLFFGHTVQVTTEVVVDAEKQQHIASFWMTGFHPWFWHHPESSCHKEMLPLNALVEMDDDDETMYHYQLMLLLWLPQLQQVANQANKLKSSQHWLPVQLTWQLLKSCCASS